MPLNIFKVPPPGACQHYVKREKRNCDNPQTWTAEYVDKSVGHGVVRGKQVKKALCQLHALRYRKTHQATIARMTALGAIKADPVPELPHCPNCGASTEIPVTTADGKRVCPFCGAGQ